MHLDCTMPVAMTEPTPIEPSAPALTLTFGVRGMTCAACQGRVEKTALKVNGVARARVNLATERLEVDVGTADSTVSELADALQQRGYELVRAAAPAQLAALQDHARDRESRRLTRRTVLALAAGLPVTVVSMALMMVPAWMHLHHDPRVLWPMWVLATFVQFGPGLDFYRGAIHSLRGGVGDMNLLVAAGSTVAWLWSTSQMLWPTDSHSIYLEASTSVIALVLLGRWMEHRARNAASDAVQKLMDLRPPIVTRLQADGMPVEIPAAEVLVGDRLLVRVGERFAVDAIVIEGSTEVDESLLTGESEPVVRKAGDLVSAGTNNIGAPVQVRASRLGDDTTLARIVELVRGAQTERPAVQNAVDRVVAIFVPTVFTIALFTAGIWAWLADWQQAMLHGVAVLVVACPCAMGLATPISLFVATTRGASAGLVFRRAVALETLALVDTVVFDKTGTLTEGRPRITAIQTDAATSVAQAVTIAASLEALSEHPLGRAFVAHAAAHNLALRAVSSPEVVAGAGIAGAITVESGGPPVICAIGRRDWLEQRGLSFRSMRDDDINQAATTDGSTVVWLAVNDHVCAAFMLADQARADAAQAIRTLKGRGLRVLLLSGDAREPVTAIAESLGVSDPRWRQSPDDKAAALRTLRSEGHVVAFVGDGINDAPALAAASVGAAMGAGSDVSLATGDLVLPGNHLLAIPRALTLARATMHNIRWNLVWAFGYNIVLIPAATGALTGIHPWLAPSPTLAALAMSFSSVFVVANALRLRSVPLD